MYIFSTLLLEQNEKREANEEISVLDVVGKPQRFIPGKNPRSRLGTENPTHMVPRTEVPKVEGEARHYYRNLTAWC